MTRIAPHGGAVDWRDAAWALGLMALLLAWDASGLDGALTRLVGTPEGFPARDLWWTRGLIHDGGRWLSGLVLAALVAATLRPGLDAAVRRERIWCLAATLLCLLAIPTLKRYSATSCPWDMAEFGGVATAVSHWRWGLSDGGPGHCFPSGHAVAAFAFLPGYFLLRLRHPRMARAWLVGVLAVGLLFALGQLLRGAHHLSHSLWSAWLCWVLSAALDAVRRVRSERLRPAQCPALAGHQLQPIDALHNRLLPGQVDTAVPAGRPGHAR